MACPAGTGIHGVAGRAAGAVHRRRGCPLRGARPGGLRGGNRRPPGADRRRDGRRRDRHPPGRRPGRPGRDRAAHHRILFRGRAGGGDTRRRRRSRRDRGSLRGGTLRPVDDPARARPDRGGTPRPPRPGCHRPEAAAAFQRSWCAGCAGAGRPRENRHLGCPEPRGGAGPVLDSVGVAGHRRRAGRFPGDEAACDHPGNRDAAAAGPGRHRRPGAVRQSGGGGRRGPGGFARRFGPGVGGADSFRRCPGGAGAGGWGRHPGAGAGMCGPGRDRAAARAGPGRDLAAACGQAADGGGSHVAGVDSGRGGAGLGAVAARRIDHPMGPGTSRSRLAGHRGPRAAPVAGRPGGGGPARSPGPSRRGAAAAGPWSHRCAGRRPGGAEPGGLRRRGRGHRAGRRNHPPGGGIRRHRPAPAATAQEPYRRGARGGGPAGGRRGGGAAGLPALDPRVALPGGLDRPGRADRHRRRHPRAGRGLRSEPAGRPGDATVRATPAGCHHPAARRGDGARGGR